jgi:hypothetical protein
MKYAGLRGIDRLRLPRWPFNDGPGAFWVLAQAEVEAAHVLRGEAIAAGYFLDLLPAIPGKSGASPDGAGVAPGPSSSN